MADNIAITQGSGTSIATEDVSGVQHQKIKIEFGTDGVATMVSASDPLPVAATIDTTGLATDATDASVASIDSKTPALGQALAAASVPVILPAATITTLTPPAAITGFATSAKQDTIIGHVDGIETLLGTIDTDTGNIATEVAGLLTDTELRATPVPVSGTVTANLSATDNAVLDDIALDTEAIKTSLAGTLTVTGGGGGVEYTEGDTDATIVGSAIMFESNTGTNTISAVSNTTPLPISDAGGTLTVDGTVAVTNAGITTIAGAVSGTEMQVDVLTMPTTAVTGTFWQATQPVSLASAPTTTVTATDLDIRNLVNTDVVTAELSAVDNAVLDTIAAKDFATQTTLAAMNAKMVTGTDIGDVTINNSTGASAVNIQDGGNTITVDGTVAVSGTVAVTQSGTWDEVGINDSGNSITVDNGGTFAVQASGTVASEDTDSGNPIKVGGVYNSTIPTYTDGDRTNLQTDSRGNIRTLLSIPSSVSTNSAGADNADDIAVSSTSNKYTFINRNTVFDGTTWDRMYGDSNNGVLVNLGANNDVSLNAGTNAIGKLSANSGVDIGDVDVTSISAGSNLIGDVSLQPRTANGLSVANFNTGDTYTALTNTAQVIKASAGNLYGYYMMNPNTTTAYVMIYNIAAASVTVGTSTAQCVFAIPAGAAANLMMPYPISFSNAGWSIAAATTGAGNTAPTIALEVQIWFK